MARKLYGAAAKAHARRMARGGHKRRRSSGRKRSRSHAVTHRRKYRRSSARSASRAGRVLRYRRSNPPFGRGIVGSVISGAIDATWIVAGKGGSRAIASFVPVSQTGAVGLAVQVASAVALGWVGRKISPNASKMLLAGGLSGVIESFVKGLNIPFISANLGDQGYYAVGSYPMGDYPRALPASVSDYPRMAGEMGDADDYDHAAM